jgi:hypothetical protein
MTYARSVSGFVQPANTFIRIFHDLINHCSAVRKFFRQMGSTIIVTAGFTRLATGDELAHFGLQVVPEKQHSFVSPGFAFEVPVIKKKTWRCWNDKSAKVKDW